MKELKILLASASPRRKQLLQEYGCNNFDVVKPYAVEKYYLTPEETVMKNTIAKFESVDKDGYDVIITADTIVVYKNKIIGKPKNYKKAKEILANLSNSTHYVYTGVYIYRKYDRDIKFISKSSVYMKKLSEQDIEKILIRSDWKDKAGGYAVQANDDLVKPVNGYYTNVVGLPVEEIKQKIPEIFI